MRLTDILLLVAYAVFMSIGQVIFKYSSQSLVGAESGAFGILHRLAMSPTFWLAIVLYGALTVLWVWILSRVSLVAAYPFVALCFVLVPIMSRYAFGERVGANYLIGSALVLAGLGFIFGEIGK